MCGVVVLGCGEGVREAGLGMRVDTLDGVVHIHHSGRAPVGSLTRTLVMGEAGGIEEASPTEFGRIRSVIADGEGRLYVADAHAFEIRVFEADGRHVGALGRRGGGPGEMEGIHGTAWLTPDTMVVIDFGNARIGLLGRTGQHLGQWPWMRATGSVRFFFPVGPGDLYARGFRPAGDAGPGQRRTEAVWVRYGVDGATDSLTVPPPGDPAPGAAVTCRGGDGIGFFTNPFTDRLLAVPAPAGERVVAMSGAYRLAFLDAAGDTTRTLTRDVEPVPLTDDDWRDTADEYARFREQWRGASCDGEIRRPAGRPALRDVGFDHHGRLLVEHETAAGPALDVYDAEWRLLTTIPLPERDTGVPLFLRDDRLHLVTRDTLGVQRVESYRISPPPGIFPD